MSCRNCNNLVPVIALEGGPCSGKSSVMDALQAADYDHPIVFIPEIASELAGQELVPRGLDYPGLAASDRAEYLVFQRRIVGGYIARIGAARQALAGSGGVVITDRSPAGVRTYVSDTEWSGVTASAGTTPERIGRDYSDAIIFLDSLAVADPAAYELQYRSNPVRTETIAQARKLHYASLAVWDGHPELVEIGGGDIEIKRQAARQIVSRLAAGTAIQ